MHAPGTFAALIAQRAASHPDFAVLTVEGAGVREDEVRTYRQLWDNGCRIARFLIDRGMRAGDRFALVMANHAEFVDTMVGAAIAGAVFVPIDPRTKGEKLAFMLEKAQCHGVIAADYALEAVLQARGQCGPAPRWVAALDTDEGPALADPPEQVFALRSILSAEGPSLEPIAQGPDAAMQVLFTSGTTGDPKGIVCTHGRFLAAAAGVPVAFGYREDDRLYSGLSLTHANAQTITLGAALHARIPCVLSRRFTKSRLWDITRRYGCTSFTLLGGMTTAVYANPPRADDANHPVRFVVSAGMPAGIWESFERRFGVQVLEFYGAAEGGMTLKPIGVGPIGSIGKPIPGLRHRIVDEHGNDVPRGTCGELLLQPTDGSTVSVHYIGDALASAKKSRDGWLWMGDIVHEDAGGWLFFHYRKGGGIRRNGDFVHPGFVEKVIAESGDVEDVYVWGVAAASGAPGEKDVVASVVPKRRGCFDPQAVFRACRERLEPNFVPTYLQVLGELPKTASEKPQDRFLLAHFERDKASVFTEFPVKNHP